MAKYFIGIDLGTSSVRAGIFRDDSILVSIASGGYPINSPSPEISEQDPEIWWKRTCESIKEALEKSNLKGSDISGISFSGQMHGAVLLNSAGDPAAPAIIWADSRSSGVLDEISGIIGKDIITKTIMNRIFPGTQLSTLFWLKKYDKAKWNKIRHVLLPKDYIRFRMCGFYNTEPSDASASLLFDLDKREWAKDVLKKLGIFEEFLPYVVNSDQNISETEGIEEETGLPDGIPLVMGGADQAAAALGNGILDDGDMFAAIGTGGQIVAPVKTPLVSPDLCLNTFCHLPETRWYIEGATLSGGLCLRWFRDNFCPEVSFETLSEEAAGVIPNPDDPVFIPYLNGKRSPDMNPSAYGVFSGMRYLHNRGHIVRAIMEGVVFELRESFEVMLKMGLKPNRLIASGGFTRSPVWMKIMADCFKIPLNISAVKEQSCFGAALTAGIGVKEYESYWKAAELVPKPEKTIEPESGNIEIYEEKYRKYLKIYNKHKES